MKNSTFMGLTFVGSFILLGAVGYWATQQDEAVNTEKFNAERYFEGDQPDVTVLTPDRFEETMCDANGQNCETSSYGQDTEAEEAPEPISVETGRSAMGYPYTIERFGDHENPTELGDCVKVVYTSDDAGNPTSAKRKRFDTGCVNKLRAG